MSYSIDMLSIQIDTLKRPQIGYSVFTINSTASNCLSWQSIWNGVFHFRTVIRYPRVWRQSRFNRAMFCWKERSNYICSSHGEQGLLLCYQKVKLLTKKGRAFELHKFYFSFIFFSELQKEEVQVRKPSFWYFLYLHHHFVLRHTLHNSLWGIVLFPDGNVHHLCFTVICAQSWDEYLIFS